MASSHFDTPPSSNHAAGDSVDHAAESPASPFDDVVTDIFQSQAALKRQYARREREDAGYRRFFLPTPFTPDRDTPCDNPRCGMDSEGFVRKGTDALMCFYYRDGSALVRHRECE